jgi:hypothetical protein
LGRDREDLEPPDTGDDTNESDGGGGYSASGPGDLVDTGQGEGLPIREEGLDMELLARHVYDLLRREALVDRERLGIR